MLLAGALAAALLPTRAVEVPDIHRSLVGYRLQVTGYRLQVTGYRLQVTGYRAQVTGRRLQGAVLFQPLTPDPCHPVTPSPRLLVSLSPCLRFTPSPRHLVTLTPQRGDRSLT